ncbi:hypothetical protein ACLESD_31405 [Pyxidicoccus sp. 3LFB2]
MPRARRTRKTARQALPRGLPARVAAAQVPAPSILSGLMNQLLALKHVTGVFVGHKVHGGEEGGLALCCLVDQKLPRRQLAKSALIPPRVEWAPTSRSRRTLKTDVLEAGAFQRCNDTLTLGPGDAVRAPGRGTVGLVMDHPAFGRVIVSAGHVFTDTTWTGTHVYEPGTEPRVSLRNIGGTAKGFRGELLKVVVTEDADYALVRPLTHMAHCGNTFRDSMPLGLPYLPSADDVGDDLYVLSHVATRATTFVGAQAQVVVGPQGIIRNVLLTRNDQNPTQPGDSGSCLIDLDRRVWGLLVGHSQRYSVFMQADVPLFFEGASYV